MKILELEQHLKLELVLNGPLQQRSRLRLLPEEMKHRTLGQSHWPQRALALLGHDLANVSLLVAGGSIAMIGYQLLGYKDTV